MIKILRKYFYYKNHITRLSNYKSDFPIQKKNINKDKFFFIIKRDRWRGMFSNLHYVILQIIYAKSKGYIPIIDMQYFPTIYNEKKLLLNSFNSWEYFFKNTCRIKLDRVYMEYNYKFSDEKTVITSIIKKSLYPEFKNILSKISIKKNLTQKFNKFKKDNFKNKKILGVHFRGSDQKTAALHPFPPTINQMLKNSELLMNQYNFDHLFLVTEEEKYFNEFKKKFGSKLITYNCYRSKTDIFKDYPRKNHRYLLGFETIINMLLLSETNYLLHSNSNFSAMARHYSKKKLKETIIDNGINSKNIFLCNILWYVKYLLPYKLGGFNNLVKKNHS